MVERWFAELTTKWLRRGSHRSTKELEASITEWIDTWNENPDRSSGGRPLTRFWTLWRDIARDLPGQVTRTVQLSSALIGGPIGLRSWDKAIRASSSMGGDIG